MILIVEIILFFSLDIIVQKNRNTELFMTGTLIVGTDTPIIAVFKIQNQVIFCNRSILGPVRIICTMLVNIMPRKIKFTVKK